MTAQNGSVRILEELGFEIINNTETDLVCKIEPLGPEDGRWLDRALIDSDAQLFVEWVILF